MLVGACSHSCFHTAIFDCRIVRQTHFANSFAFELVHRRSYGKRNVGGTAAAFTIAVVSEILTMQEPLTTAQDLTTKN